ncbi:efflux RND transporter periplasmic adaptor subunit [Halosquirtibacter laminarini]|uniref:Efflux RND transporter periplasmic adaptor subunit n=1 Tax=Halosquirtibacter laminarini TaxID=3374600 RepID=A0AC61NF24_9BACT|nr:efflux RND transporter periplasmic adaptor subunit [Prolixibacteraceae bacterium]
MKHILKKGLTKKRWIFVTVSAVILTLFLIFNKGEEKKNIITANVESQDLIIDVNTTGELDALNSVKIQAPEGLRKARLWQVKINKIVEEGKRVKKGEFIAELDKSTLSDQIKNSSDDVILVESNMIQQRLDTTLSLRQARDNILNLEYQVKEAEIKLEQSAFEPPATIKQAKMNVQKSKRSLDQSKMSYEVKQKQMSVRMTQLATKYSKKKRQLDFLISLQSDFTIIAPEDGMVIYKKDNWSGQKVKEGSTINAYDATVATLPDLSKMVSKTYINEVDIRKIKKNQQVEIGLDAFPDKHYTGVVTKIANVGEQKPNSDAKVFEVEITINESDSIFRPAMTTSNRIITKVIEDQKLIPIEALFTDNDSTFFVYRKAGFGFKKQFVKIGESNDQNISITNGLEANDVVSLNRIEE